MSEPLRVTGLTAGRTVPGARFRVGQFVAPLREHGVALEWRTAPVRKHPPRARWLRPFWFPASVLGRVPGVLASRRADVTLFSRELVSTFVTLEPWAGRPRVLDVDDAIWLRRGGGYARRLAGLCDAVVAGNDHVAEWFGRYCGRVEVLPTAVDTARFSPGPARPADGPVVIGWSGTSTNFPYLASLQTPLARVLRERPDVRIAISSDRRPDLPDLPADRVDFTPWTEAGEVAFLRGLDMGLMPLADDDWARGKCAYKMLLYLACGVPVAVSPVGMNAQVLAEADVGHGPADDDAWVEALLDLADDPEGRRRRGERGAELVRARYSVAATAPRLAALLRDVAGAGA